MICPKCKGKGDLPDINICLAVITFGLTALIEANDRKECPMCEGDGQVEDKDRK